MRANWISNGLGGQSMFLLHLAAEREIPATLSITADTQGEFDRVCSTGERMTARAFFDRHVQPYAERHGIEAIMVRSQDRDGKDLIGLKDLLEQICVRSTGEFDQMIKGLLMPFFTNDRTKGRLRQSCTDKMKIRAINQEAKRRGIKVLRSAIGFHSGECHRIKARYTYDDSGFSVYKPQVNKDGVLSDIRWLEHYYPCIDLGVDRAKIRRMLDKIGLPYLITTECDFCPHQDWQRWRMHTPEVLEDIARLEAAFQGKIFFTDQRIPLKEALLVMEQKARAAKFQMDLPMFGCESGAYCGI